MVNPKNQLAKPPMLGSKGKIDSAAVAIPLKIAVIFSFNLLQIYRKLSLNKI
jgi:hypothetical protein